MLKVTKYIYVPYLYKKYKKQLKLAQHFRYKHILNSWSSPEEGKCNNNNNKSNNGIYNNISATGANLLQNEYFYFWYSEYILPVLRAFFCNGVFFR